MKGFDRSPVAHIAASRIVRCERENVVAAELTLQFGKIPDPVTDVKGGIVEVVLCERFPELSRDPCGGLRHELHQPDRTAIRARCRLKLTLVFDDGRNEEWIRALLRGTRLDVAAVVIGVEPRPLDDRPAADEGKGDCRCDNKAQQQP